MINSLTIELALSRPPGLIEKGKDVYKVVQTTFPVNDLDIDRIVLGNRVNEQSFLYKLQHVSNYRLKLLRYIEEKVLNMIEKNFAKFTNNRAYFIPGSYLYFSFIDEQSVNVFSSPHITSPIIFNPNDNIGTYTLNIAIRNNNLTCSKDTLIYKRLSKKAANLDYKQVLRNRAIPDREDYLNNYDISNSLFDYYEKSENGNDYTSCYTDEKPPLYKSKITIISDYELKKFYYLSDNSNQ